MGNQNEEKQITRMGNPGKPRGEEGVAMLKRMNMSHSSVTDWALNQWELKENDLVLDIGCGGGAALQRITEKIVTGHTYGIDYSENSVGLSKETNAENINSGKTDIILSSVENIPFENDYFDKIITVESFYFWPSPVENLKEVCRVLKSGGELMIVADIYNNGALNEEEMSSVIEFNLFNPSKEEFRKIIADAGFSSSEIITKDNTSWICVKGIK